MIVRYKCFCNPDEHTLILPDRRWDAHDVTYLDNTVLPAMVAHHRSMSPRCRKKTYESVELPDWDSAVTGRPHAPA